MQYEWEIRDDDDGYGYTNRLLNAGFRQLVTIGGTPTPQDVIINGAKASSAVPLQQDGTYKALSIPPATTVEPYYLEFQDFPRVKFADLNIPEDILTADQ